MPQILPPGSIVEFLRNRATISGGRSAALAERFSEIGYESASDFKGMSAQETSSHFLQNEIGMLSLEVRKFKRAVEAFNRDQEVDEKEVACLEFLADANLAYIFPDIKAEAGGTVSVEDLCNPDFVSDSMLVNFGLGKAHIRRYRRVVRLHQGGAAPSSELIDEFDTRSPSAPSDFAEMGTISPKLKGERRLRMRQSPQIIEPESEKPSRNHFGVAMGGDMSEGSFM